MRSVPGVKNILGRDLLETEEIVRAVSDLTESELAMDCKELWANGERVNLLSEECQIKKSN